MVDHQLLIVQDDTLKHIVEVMRHAAGKLAGYLKKILEGSEEKPDCSGDTADDSEKILDYLMDLPSTNLEILWRRAKRYNDVAECQLDAVDDMELG